MTQYSIPRSQFLLEPVVSQSMRKKQFLPAGRDTKLFVLDFFFAVFDEEAADAAFCFFGTDLTH